MDQGRKSHDSNFELYHNEVIKSKKQNSLSKERLFEYIYFLELVWKNLKGLFDLSP